MSAASIAQLEKLVDQAKEMDLELEKLNADWNRKHEEAYDLLRQMLSQKDPEACSQLSEKVEAIHQELRAMEIRIHPLEEFRDITRKRADALLSAAEAQKKTPEA